MDVSKLLNNPNFVVKVEMTKSGDGDKKKKLTAQQKALKATLNYICENTSNLTKIFTHLIEKNVISYDEHQEIMNFGTDTKKLFELMRLFERKPPEAFAIFNEILIKTGNDHVSNKIKVKEGELSDDKEDDDDDKHIDENCPGVDDLFKFYGKTKEKVEKMKYLPQTLFSVSRFNDVPLGSSLPSEKFANSIQKFRSNRAIFLKQIGFYGPAAIPLTSYEVSVSVSQWKPNGDSKPFDSISEVIEVAKDELMFIAFDDPVPIRPHLWHCITFTIKGQEKMVHQVYQSTAKMAYVDYKKSVYDAVRIEFDMSSEYSSGQAPEFWFFKAIDRIESSFFPKAEEEEESIPPRRPDGKSKPVSNNNNVGSAPVDSDCGCVIT